MLLELAVAIGKHHKSNARTNKQTTFIFFLVGFLSISIWLHVLIAPGCAEGIRAVRCVYGFMIRIYCSFFSIAQPHHYIAKFHYEKVLRSYVLKQGLLEQLGFYIVISLWMGHGVNASIFNEQATLAMKPIHQSPFFEHKLLKCLLFSSQLLIASIVSSRDMSTSAHALLVSYEESITRSIIYIKNIIQAPKILLTKGFFTFK